MSAEQGEFGTEVSAEEANRIDADVLLFRGSENDLSALKVLQLVPVVADDRVIFGDDLGKDIYGAAFNGTDLSIQWILEDGRLVELLNDKLDRLD